MYSLQCNVMYSVQCNVMYYVYCAGEEGTTLCNILANRHGGIGSKLRGDIVINGNKSVQSVYSVCGHTFIYSFCIAACPPAA